MNNNKISCAVCRGFNNFFDVPKADGKTPAIFRTAIVIKKRDFYDEWDVYDALFWRIIQRIALDLNASIRIRCPEYETGEMQSLEELRIWQKEQASIDSEFGIDAPTEIRFFKGGSLLCLMTLEDWSDVGKIEPYSCSYTFSLYSYEKTIDESIDGSIAEQLSHDEEVGEISAFQECNSPKWYWPFLNVVKSDSFFICAGFCVLALLGIAIIAVSPSSTHEKNTSLYTKRECDNLGITWHRDVAPIQKRIAVLASCTNMLWHGEIITKDSFMSPVGPSAYRVCCFIPDASQLIHGLTALESNQEVANDGIDFLQAEKAMLKSEYKIDTDVDTGILNEQLTHKLLQSPYWGQSMYFKASDVLCIVLFGE